MFKTCVLRYTYQTDFEDMIRTKTNLQILLNKFQSVFPNVAAGNMTPPPHPTPDAPSSRITLVHSERWTSTGLPNRL